MKYLLALALLLVATPVFAADCGLGQIPFSTFSVETKQAMGMPYFVRAERDGDGKIEGRSDSIWMIQHDSCVESLKN